MNPEDKIYVAGHNGMVGSAIVRELRRLGFDNIVTQSRSELDLGDAPATARFFAEQRPRYVFLAAARVGGIAANASLPVPFLTENLAIQTSVLGAAHESAVDKLMFLGSSCVYPREAPQPLKEEYLMSGPLEPTNESYALAKIVGLKLCDAYRRQFGSNFVSVMPCNLYGPHDDFDSSSSHVVPALLRRFHEAKQRADDAVQIWGSGKPRRELMYVDDLAAACVHLMREWNDPGFINVGTGNDCTIADLASTIAEVVGYQGRLEFDPSRPDGMPRKLLDVSRLSALGWNAQTELRAGLELTYRWFLEHHAVD